MFSFGRRLSEKYWGPINYSSGTIPAGHGGFDKLEVRVQGKDGFVHLTAGRRAGWVPLGAEQARKLGKALLAAADAVEKIGQQS